MGVGLYIWKQKNVIVRNIISQDVLAANGDGVGVQASSNVWIDHWFVLFPYPKSVANTSKASSPPTSTTAKITTMDSWT